MIVEPDFLTHWKTRALARLLDYEAAPMCVLSLWAHCQQRKTDRFQGMTPEVFASICGYPFAEPGKFYEAMVTCGFVETEGETLIVHDFAKANAQLFANWQNGLRGGRPSLTQRKPINNPSETQSENGQTDRLDKIGEEKSTKKEKVATAPLARKSRKPAPSIDDKEWREGLKRDPAYSHIRIGDEFSKCERWCKRHRKLLTQARFEAWLNRIEKPIASLPASRTIAAPKVLPPPPPEMSDEQREAARVAWAQEREKLNRAFGTAV